VHLWSFNGHYKHFERWDEKLGYGKNQISSGKPKSTSGNK